MKFKFQNGGPLSDRQLKKIRNKVYRKNPILSTVGKKKDFEVIGAKDRALEHLEESNRNPEYFPKGDTWFPYYNSKKDKEGNFNEEDKISIGGSTDAHRTLVNPYMNKDETESAVRLDLMSHSLHKNPEYNKLTEDLGNKLISKYGEEFVERNGGVDAYVRGLIAGRDSPEYGIYVKEMEEAGIDTSDIQKFLSSKKRKRRFNEGGKFYFKKGGIVKYKSYDTDKGKFTSERYLSKDNESKVDKKTNEYKEPKSEYGKSLENFYQDRLNEVKSGNLDNVNVTKDGTVTFSFSNKDFRLGSLDAKEEVEEKKKKKTEDKVEEKKIEDKTVVKVGDKKKDYEVKDEVKEVDTEVETEVEDDKVETVVEDKKKDKTKDKETFNYMDFTLDWEDKNYGHINRYGILGQGDEDMSLEDARKIYKTKLDERYDHDELPMPLRVMAGDFDYNHKQDSRIGIMQTAGIIGPSDRITLYGNKPIIDTLWNNNKNSVMQSYRISPIAFMKKYRDVKDEIYSNTNKSTNKNPALGKKYKNKSQLFEWQDRNAKTYREAMKYYNKKKSYGGSLYFKNGGSQKKESMVLLDHNGQPQMDLEGGELIFSRTSSKKIIDLAVKATNEEGLKRLGKAIYEERKEQIKRDNKRQ